MKFGMGLHPNRGIDAVVQEAIQADQQGFDSMWITDHLMDWRYELAPQTPEMKGETRRLTLEAEHFPERPFDSFTLMTALGAVTNRISLGWATLNLSFRAPAVMAKMLTTLDQITHGRVIACVGSGWYREEGEAYGTPLLDDHLDRMAYATDVIRLWKELWAHPAPEKVSFESKFFTVKDLPFNPVAVQQPHIPIWWGGDSEASVDMVKRFADGWMMTGATSIEKIRNTLTSEDWPDRPMTVIRGLRIFPGETRDEAIQSAEREYQRWRTAAANPRAVTLGIPPATFEDFLASQIFGSVDECIDQLAELWTLGINYVRMEFPDEATQDRIARLLLPRMDDVEERAAALQSRGR